MSPRFLQSIGVAAVIGAVIVLLKLVSVPLAGANASAVAADVSNAGPAPVTAWGEADLQGIWRDDYQVPLQRPSRYASKEFFTDEERAALDKIRAAVPRFGDVGLAPRGSEQDVSGAYNAVFTSTRPTGRRTSMIVEPRDGRIPPFTSEAKGRNDAIRDFRLALLQATSICKNQLPGCLGGKYGAPSPRRAEAPPYYPATGAAAGGSFNRADGPEDRGLSERCMAATMPDFGGFRRIVQSPGAVAIFYDTGQGQGWQRIIPITTRPHLPSHIRQWWGDSRGHWEGKTLVVDVANFTPKTDYQGSRENLHLVERWTRLDAHTLEYVVRVEDPATWTRPWTFKQELSRQRDRKSVV